MTDHSEHDELTAEHAEIEKLIDRAMLHVTIKRWKRAVGYVFEGVRERWDEWREGLWLNLVEPVWFSGPRQAFVDLLQIKIRKHHDTWRELLYAALLTALCGLPLRLWVQVAHKVSDPALEGPLLWQQIRHVIYGGSMRNTAKITCPWCGREGRSLTSTGKIIKHDDPSKQVATLPFGVPCEGTSKRPEDHQEAVNAG